MKHFGQQWQKPDMIGAMWSPSNFIIEIDFWKLGDYKKIMT